MLAVLWRRPTETGALGVLCRARVSTGRDAVRVLGVPRAPRAGTALVPWPEARLHHWGWELAKKVSYFTFCSSHSVASTTCPRTSLATFELHDNSVGGSSCPQHREAGPGTQPFALTSSPAFCSSLHTLVRLPAHGKNRREKTLDIKYLPLGCGDLLAKTHIHTWTRGNRNINVSMASKGGIQEMRAECLPFHC